MTVSTKGGYFSPEEINAYVKHLQEKFPNCDIDELAIEVDEKDKDFVKLDYKLINKPETNVPITRIRRITGYLSSMSRMNDAKYNEVLDRVKHG